MGEKDIASNHTIENPFSSFWMGGYECSDKLNAFGNRVDLLSETGHLLLVDEDYKRLKPFNIRTVREGIRWSQVEKSPYQYNWGEVRENDKSRPAAWHTAGMGPMPFRLP